MAEAGGGGYWGIRWKGRPHAPVAVLQPLPRPLVPAPHSAQPGLGLLGGIEGPKSSTWRKEETPGVGLRRPLSGGGPLPRLPLPLFCACSLEAGASHGGVVREGPSHLPWPPLAEAALLKQNITGRCCPGLPSSPASLAAGLPLVVAGLKPWGGASASPHDSIWSRAGNVALSGEENRRWCLGSVWGGLPRAYPTFSTVPLGR